MNTIPIAEATDFVLNNDRLLYNDYFRIIEEYCVSNKILIGGKVGMDLLFNKPIVPNTYVYDIYCDNTYVHAKTLSIELMRAYAPHLPGLIAMNTEIRNQEFSIAVNTRVICKVNSINRHRGIRLIDLITPQMRKGYFSDLQIPCVSELMQMISTLRILYSPNRTADWQYYWQKYDVLYQNIMSTRDEIKRVIGDGRRETLRNMSELAKYLHELPDTCIVGDWAVNELRGAPQTGRAQIITSLNVKQICNEMQEIWHAGALRYVEFQTNILDDFRFTKFTIYSVNDDEREPICDVFNSTSYECVPYVVRNNVKIAGYFVLMRIRLIDVWIMQLILNIGETNKDYSLRRIDEIMNDVSYVHQKIITAPLLELFQIDNYLGVTTNERVAKSKAKGNKKFYTFYPELQNREEDE